MVLFSLPDPQSTDAFGAAFSHALTKIYASWAETGLAIRLEGNLGAGKTSFARATLRALGFDGPVKSPTFSLVETYPLGLFDLNHFDFYRFEEASEFDDAGFRDLFKENTVCLTEWSDKALPYLPDADLSFIFTIDGEGRRVELVAHTSLGKNLTKEVTQAWM